MMNPLPPVLTAHLFPKIEAELCDLLRSLTAEDWERRTVAPRWNVKNVAAHLLDTHLRKLSFGRDRYMVPGPPITDLVAFVDNLNREGVAMYSRYSPAVLVSVMELAARQTADYYQSLDPFANARIAVSWAGEEVSANWFDTAREFTERWHHQQQIRLAVDRPGIMTPELYHPVLDCFLRALPYTFRAVPAREGVAVQVEIAGDCGGAWWLYRGSDSWRLVEEAPGAPAAKVTIPQEIAWRIFTKGFDRASAEAQSRIEGDAELVLPVLSMKAIVG